MLLRLGLILSILLCATPAGAGHDADIDVRRATPGLRLELDELPPTAAQTTKRYRLHAYNYPRGVVFGVFTRNFGEPFEEIASGFQVNEGGKLVSSGVLHSRRLEEMPFAPGPYPRGAAWEVALVSGDRNLLAFARIIPHPIAARDGACTVQLELVSFRGTHFVATGAGFAPGEEAIGELKYSGRVVEKRQRISPEGLLPLNVLAHQPIGADRNARYSVKARSCTVTLDYEWGQSALVRR
jgi:hypothetical protein